MIIENLIEYLYIVPAALIAIIFHEFAHGLVSTWFGDPTPAQSGRLTLNPLKHIDPIGAACLVLFHFGWARPVMVDPSYYKNRKVGLTVVALAGPIMNFLIMFVAFIVIAITLRIQINYNLENNIVITIIYKFFAYLAILNIGLGVFNLIPIPPLDGSKAIGIVLPGSAYDEYMGYQKYGTYFMIAIMFILYILSFFDITSPVVTITSNIYNYFIELIEKLVIK